MDFSYIKKYLKGRSLVLYGMGAVCQECRAALELSGIPIAAYTASSISVPPPVQVNSVGGQLFHPRAFILRSTMF